MPKRDLARFIRQESGRQAEEWRRVRVTLDTLNQQIAKHTLWLKEDCDMWGAIGAACSKSRLESLALGAGKSIEDKPRDIFLAALSTQDTYDAAWKAVIKASSGCEHECLLDIYRIECHINALVCPMVRDASVYFRGTSLEDARNMRTKWAGYSRSRFVTMTMSPQEAYGFAVGNYEYDPGPRVVMILDAPYLRDLGVKPARYSIASDVLELVPPDEGVARTSRLGLAREAEAHIKGRWPPESSEALWGISPVGKPDAHLLEEAERLGVMVVSFDDTVAVFGGAGDPEPPSDELLLVP